uniref:At1g61320/AtMIF1 LRR domain-containing protein n=1 Tax=Oryza punctata TaxID=4537 RepID=A0A0E0KAK3_ORYPU
MPPISRLDPRYHRTRGLHELNPTYGIIYIPCCHCEMPPVLLACLGLFYISGGISQKDKHDLTFKDPICLRQIPEHWHYKLKNVKITGFGATRSLVELTCHILENATSLECLTLDTLCTQIRCSDGNIDVCLPLDQDVIKGVHNSLLAIRTYIEEKVPSTVKFNVLEPCSRCHAIHSQFPIHSN